jgi:hypothetical protein
VSVVGSNFIADAHILQILQLTNPDQWTAAAMFQATRLFASNFNPKLAQRCD